MRGGADKYLAPTDAVLSLPAYLNDTSPSGQRLRDPFSLASHVKACYKNQTIRFNKPLKNKDSTEPYTLTRSLMVAISAQSILFSILVKWSRNLFNINKYSAMYSLLLLFNILIAVIMRMVYQLYSTLDTIDVPLLAKCCPLGETLQWTGDCAPSDLPFEPIFWEREPPPEQVDLLVGGSCPYGRYPLEPEESGMDEFHLLHNCSLLVPFLFARPLSPLEFCLDTVSLDGEAVVRPYLCFDPPPPESRWRNFTLIVYPIGCLVSVPFLLITVAVFLWFKHLRLLRGKVISCYAFCLAMAYSSLALVQLTGRNLSAGLCIAIAFLIQFWFLAGFFWLNVLCYHTWWRMRLSCKKESASRVSESRRFLMYSLYGWLCPLVLLGASLIMDLTPSIPSSYLKPNFGLNTCWFSSNEAAVPYFYGPVAGLLVLNVVFYLLTARHLHLSSRKHLQSAPSVRSVAWGHILERRRTLFVECLLQFCAMGLNWVVEVVSWAVGGPPEFWFLTDVFNSLQGLILFLVFVAKDPEVMSALKSLFRRRRPHLYTAATITV